MTPTTRATLATAAWRKSSHSGDEGACLELAVITPAVRDSLDAVAVRDSKDPAGPVLLFGPAAWAAFTTAPPTRPES
ncbi:protein of unknown function [Micromonospora pallida]|uniref:DUF397 domain-containing protein n=1 Tax=Micromonospora pallida TaxID=145854 RepID=A0A1C6SXJ8_9ACTN|nr:DUF397 domain-containing protein [Micromonospora pallida]SCL34013.1 protein of unknown function [Micromonospora pallida]